MVLDYPVIHFVLIFLHILHSFIEGVISGELFDRVLIDVFDGPGQHLNFKSFLQIRYLSHRVHCPEVS